MGGKPSKGTKKDMRLKRNNAGAAKQPKQLPLPKKPFGKGKGAR